MQPIVAWTEVPVSNLKAACDFYANVFGWKMEISQMGPNEVSIFNGADVGAGGHLYEGKPGTGTTIHLTLPGTVEEAAVRVAEAGGQVMGPIIDVPTGRFQYAADLDGNSIGLYEHRGDA